MISNRQGAYVVLEDAQEWVAPFAGDAQKWVDIPFDPTDAG